MTNDRFPLAPPWQVAGWLNAPEPPTLVSLRGRVVVLEAFQMLCPGCVSHALPQALRLQSVFAQDDVAVIGLHAVFEHHEAMTPVALSAFVHEYRLGFPIAIDRHAGGNPIPLTMRAYALQGTPSTLLIDRAGRIRLHHFGQLDDMRLAARVALLVAERADETVSNAPMGAGACGGDECGGLR